MTKKNRWASVRQRDPDKFTYRRTADGEIEFLVDGSPLFKKSVACEPDQALNLVRALNRISPKYLDKRGNEVIKNFFAFQNFEKVLKTSEETESEKSKV